MDKRERDLDKSEGAGGLGAAARFFAPALDEDWREGGARGT